MLRWLNELFPAKKFCRTKPVNRKRKYFVFDGIGIREVVWPLVIKVPREKWRGKWRNMKVVQNKNKRNIKKDTDSWKLKRVKVTLQVQESRLFVSLLYLIKMAQAQPQSHGVNRPNPLGPYNPIRKHSEPERYLSKLIRAYLWQQNKWHSILDSSSNYVKEPLDWSTPIFSVTSILFQAGRNS